MKRLTTDIPKSLHTLIKLCVQNRQKMADALRALLEEHWPGPAEDKVA
jgi:hypothetical protein